MICLVNILIAGYIIIKAARNKRGKVYFLIAFLAILLNILPAIRFEIQNLNMQGLQVGFFCLDKLLTILLAVSAIRLFSKGGNEK